ncbi:MAG: acyl-CoA reductase, partial [Bacteroidetes bacterium]|nr:acyl-CoA reductase [Bacteroidota bacterium]
MTTTQQIFAWCQLGRLLKAHAKSLEWHTDIDFISEQQYISFEKTIEKTFHRNGWFEQNEVRNALLEISDWLTETNLENWQSNYKTVIQKNMTVAIIMAGNIPLVGFHDLICVLFSGFKAKIKLSSEDDLLIPEVINYLTSIAPFY